MGFGTASSHLSQITKGLHGSGIEDGLSINEPFEGACMEYRHIPALKQRTALGSLNRQNKMTSIVLVCMILLACSDRWICLVSSHLVSQASSSSFCQHLSKTTV